MEMMLKSFGAKFEEASAVHSGHWTDKRGPKVKQPFVPFDVPPANQKEIWTGTYRWGLI